MKNRKKIHDDWKTPEWLLEYIKNKYFNGKSFFDPCPINSKFDGILIKWRKRNYVNPPYNRKDKEEFIEKAFCEYQNGKHIVMLLPVSTSTNVFHKYILPFAHIEFLYGRVNFIGYNTNGDLVKDKVGQHDSMIVEYK
jgi:hypothetical protein